jgi:signal transduction histidine kinase
VGLNTLRSRLVAATVLVAALLAVAVVVLVQALMARLTSGDAENLARARAEGSLGAIHVVSGHAVVDESVTDIGGQALDRSVWIFDSDGTLLDGRVPAQLRPIADRLGQSTTERTLRRERELLLALPVTRSGARVATVVASVDLTPYEQSERRQLGLTLALGLLAVALAAAVARQVAGYALAPVRRMARSADAWQAHDTDRRFGLGEPVDEIGELGRTLDHMLERIATTLAAERRLTDELAHQLRTPLTVIRTEAELAARTDLPEPARESLTAIVATVERVETEIRTILATARARASEPDHCDVRSVVEPLLRSSAVPVRVVGDAEAGVPAGMLATVLTPLLDNAARHARSAALVEIQEGVRVTVTVSDDGEGVRAEDAERIFEPGWSGSDGTGLGLSLARRVAAALGASVEVVPGDGGRFVVTLPRA